MDAVTASPLVLLQCVCSRPAAVLVSPIVQLLLSVLSCQLPFFSLLLSCCCSCFFSCQPLFRCSYVSPCPAADVVSPLVRRWSCVSPCSPAALVSPSFFCCCSFVSPLFLCILFSCCCSCNFSYPSAVLVSPLFSRCSCDVSCPLMLLQCLLLSSCCSYLLS